MMIKLYAVNVVAGTYPFSKVPKVLKAKVKQQIALMVEDDEILAELTKE
ncbi:CD1375 family protein [Streptococcus sp. HMSC061D10]|nr:CD1375 family protein [Streptococcus sp. HMSC061D10]